MKLAAMLAVLLAALPFVPQGASATLPFSFSEIGARAGLTVPTVYGGQKTNRYLLETTGCGAAATSSRALAETA